MGRSNSPLRDRLAFVVGARRSGTNLVERILAAHPGVVVIPSETHLFTHGLKPLVERIQTTAPRAGSPGAVFMDGDDLRDGLRDFCDRLFGGWADAIGGRPGSMIVERTPWHAYALDLITDVYPDAAVIHVVRDGRDVTRSLLSQDWGPTSMEEAAEEWRSSVEAAQSVAGRARVHLEVRYEELILDAESGAAHLYDALGLEAVPVAMADALLAAGVRFNVDAMSPEVGWGKWRGALSDEDLVVFYDIAGGCLEDLGYPMDGAPSADARQGGQAAPRRRFRGRVSGRASRRQAQQARRVVEQLQRSQQLLESFSADVQAGRWEQLATCFTDRVKVRAGGPDPWSGTGPTAVERLISLLEQRPEVRDLSARWETAAAVPHSTLACTTSRAGAGHGPTVFVLTMEDEAVTEVLYLPPG